VVALVRRWEQETGRRPGLYIELKHPTYFQAEGVRLNGDVIGLDLSELLIEALKTSEFTDPGRVFIQCFEVWPLIDLKQRMSAADLHIPLIQLYADVFNRRYRAAPRDLVYYGSRGDVGRYGELGRLLGLAENRENVSYADLARPEVLAFMAERYADGIGPPRTNVLEVQMGADGAPTVTGAVEPFFRHAQAAGLLVHPYTLRAELPFLFIYEGRPLTIGDEARMLIRAGVNGFFIDQPSEGRLAVDAESHQRGTQP
jgi:glycerophosphoryl diester phosphodiesterase